MLVFLHVVSNGSTGRTVVKGGRRLRYGVSRSRGGREGLRRGGPGRGWRRGRLRLGLGIGSLFNGLARFGLRRSLLQLSLGLSHAIDIRVSAGATGCVAVGGGIAVTEIEVWKKPGDGFEL